LCHHLVLVEVNQCVELSTCKYRTGVVKTRWHFLPVNVMSISVLLNTA
jgi:hypothetical protein